MTANSIAKGSGELSFSKPELIFGSCTFDELVDLVGEQAAEVAARKEDLILSAGELIRMYEVSQDFFATQDNAIGLLLSAGLHDDARQTAGKSERRQHTDSKIAENFARTLFGRYSDKYPLEDVKKSSQLAPEAKLALQEKYKNRELSYRLHQWFETTPDLQDVRTKMGITNNLEPFNVVVLSMGQELHTKNLGTANDSPQNMEGYVQAMHERATAFMEEQGSDPEDSLPYAYAATILGETYLYIMEPTARIVLEPESVGYKDEDDAADLIQALLRHEFVHTQGNVELVDNNKEETSSYIGILIEEFRAEVLSGFKFKSFYGDIYDSIAYIEQFTSVRISDIIASVPLGGSKDKVALYGALICNLGLSTTAKLAGLMPEDYVNFQSPKSSRTLYETLGSGDLTNEIVSKMTDAEIETLIADKDITDEAKDGLRNWLFNIKYSARQ